MFNSFSAFKMGRLCNLISYRNLSTTKKLDIKTPYCSRWIKRLERMNANRRIEKPTKYLDSIPETEVFTEEDVKKLSITPTKPIWNTRRYLNSNIYRYNVTKRILGVEFWHIKLDACRFGTTGEFVTQ